MRIVDYAAEIRKLEQGECETFSEDYNTGDLTSRVATPSDICGQLQEIRSEIQKFVWAPVYVTQAHELVARADREIKRLCLAHSPT